MPEFRPPFRPGEPLAYGWALRRADGVVVVDTRCSDERDIWKIALGWPSADEITEAYMNGARAYRIVVTTLMNAQPMLAVCEAADA